MGGGSPPFLYTDSLSQYRQNLSYLGKDIA